MPAVEEVEQGRTAAAAEMALTAAGRTAAAVQQMVGKEDYCLACYRLFCLKSLER